MTRRTRNVGRRRCAVEGCSRLVRVGKVVCVDHARTTAGKDVQRAVHRLASDLTATRGTVSGEDGTATGGKFRQRVARGDYDQLLDTPLQQMVWQAATERYLDDEIGSLRLAAKRLLLEEEDASKMALGLSRVTAALMRVFAGKEEIERIWRVEARAERQREQQEAHEEQTRAEEQATREQAAQQEDGKRYTIADAVKEWRARQEDVGDVRSDVTTEGERGATTEERPRVRPEIDYRVPWDGKAEGVIDAFAERLPGG